MMEGLTLRREAQADHRAVEELTREAFWNHYGPGCTEHYLAHILRNSESFLEELDFVALLKEKIVGNIMYTRAKILCDDGREQPTLCFGPVSVLPEYQGRGIGAALIEHTRKIATDLGHAAILIYGDPDYYGRFGFVAAEVFGIGTSDDRYAAALQSLELIKGALSHASGRFLEAPVYCFDEAEASAFDRSFPFKERRTGLPSQERFAQVIKMNRPRR